MVVTLSFRFLHTALSRRNGRWGGGDGQKKTFNLLISALFKNMMTNVASLHHLIITYLSCPVEFLQR